MVFGTVPSAAKTGAPNRAAIPVGFMIRCFTIGTSFPRPRQIAASSLIRQGN